MTAYTHTPPLRPTYNPDWHGDCVGDWGLSEYEDDQATSGTALTPADEARFQAWLEAEGAR